MSAVNEQYPSVVIFRLGNELPSNISRRLNQVLKNLPMLLRVVQL